MNPWQENVLQVHIDLLLASVILSCMFLGFVSVKEGPLVATGGT